MSADLPYQQEIAKIAQENNIEAYYIGGIIRDRLLHRRNKDIDIVTVNQMPEVLLEKLQQLVPDSHLAIAGAYGTAQLRLPNDIVLEGVRARSESYDENSRKPKVVPTTLLEDVLRRDFTINCLFAPVIAPNFLQDLTGLGFTDLQNKIIRTPLSPDVTFSDDPLRMLRAIRFATQLDFKLENSTLQSIKKMSPRIKIISIERIQAELDKILLSIAPSKGIRLLNDTGLLAFIIPELTKTKGISQNEYHKYDVFDHSLATLDAMPNDLTLRLAGLFHDIGKPRTKVLTENGTIHFYNHEDVGAELTATILHRLRYPQDLIKNVKKLVSMHMLPMLYSPTVSDKAVRRIIAKVGNFQKEVLSLAKADMLASSNPDQEKLESLKERMENLDTKEKAIAKHTSPLDGKTIMKILKLNQGPKVGKAKSLLQEAIINGDIQAGDKKAAKTFLLKQKKITSNSMHQL